MSTVNEEPAPISLQSPQSTVECCMCGDYGFSYELFRCKICHFRSQHRYCSNQYPNAESYRFCNWCLNQKENSVQQNSPNSSSSHKSNIEEDTNRTSLGFSKGQKGVLRLQISDPMAIKKKKSPEVSPLAVRKKSVASIERVEVTKTNGGIGKHVFRNKVRRYKHLDEVSS